MNEKHAKFLELAKLKEELNGRTEMVRVELEVLMLELGFGSYVQDPVTTCVYKVVKPHGKFMYFQQVDYVRTALEGERSGSLSKKDAEAAGFMVTKS